jgi:osmoprotectant transport system permease protein
MSLLAYWQSHARELALLTGQHVGLVAVSTLVAIAIGVPIGIAAFRRPALGKPVGLLINVAQTIPSLALLGFLIPLPFIGGIGPRTAIVALVLYALLPVVRGTIVGLQTIDPAVREAAIAMGMRPGELLRIVELPLARASIVSGIRVATVIAVGTATIAAAIGAGGLGEYIFRGLSMVDSTVILAGAIPAALLALAPDGLLAGLHHASSRPAGTTRTEVTGIAAAVLALFAVLAASGVQAYRAGDRVVVGSKNFTEQIVLGEIVAQSLEREGVKVDRRLNLGGTFICDRALRAGDIDVYVEYTGTALTAIFRQPPQTDRMAVRDAVRRLYASSGRSMLAPLGFNNTFAILVRGADARRLGLRTIDDAAAYAPGWRAGFGYEFLERADGFAGLARTYGLRFAASPRVMDLSLTYRALAAGEVDLIAGDATAGLIAVLDLAMLEDDRHYFPPYDAVPVALTATVLREPRLRQALARLAGRIDEAAMRRLNYAVAGDKRDPAVGAAEFIGSLPR